MSHSLPGDPTGEGVLFLTTGARRSELRPRDEERSRVKVRSHEDDLSLAPQRSLDDGLALSLADTGRSRDEPRDHGLSRDADRSRGSELDRFLVRDPFPDSYELFRDWYDLLLSLEKDPSLDNLLFSLEFFLESLECLLKFDNLLFSLELRLSLDLFESRLVSL